MISGRGWSTLACCRESLRAEKWSSNGPLAGRSMGASGAGAPNQPELPAAANLPLVHPIALAYQAVSVDLPAALAYSAGHQRARVPGSVLSCALTRIITMAVPKKKVSPSRRDMRRSHHALSIPVVVEDKQTGEYRRPHHIDLKTGMYRGRQVLVRKAETDDAGD